jgi:hypothetical protein
MSLVHRFVSLGAAHCLACIVVLRIELPKSSSRWSDVRS